MVARLPPHLEQAELSDPQFDDREADPGDPAAAAECGESIQEWMDGTSTSRVSFPQLLISAGPENGLAPFASSGAHKQELIEHAGPREYLIVNRAQVVRRNCNACDGPFAPMDKGETVLVACTNGSLDLFFCVGCGNNIMCHLSPARAAQSYGWDWAYSLRDSADTDTELRTRRLVSEPD